MYIDQLSLTNQRIRNALKGYDSSEVTDAVLVLLHGDQVKADKLGEWFRFVAESCKKGIYLSDDVVMMRMWQLGNVDIKEIDNFGNPIFALTFSGSSVIKSLPKEEWFNALLDDNISQAA